MHDPRPHLLLLRAAAPLGSAFIHVPPGATILTVETDDPGLERDLHLELWRVERAVGEVKTSYGLMDIAVEVVVRDMGGLGATRPALGRRTDAALAVLGMESLTTWMSTLRAQRRDPAVSAPGAAPVGRSGRPAATIPSAP